jgi:DNA recombination protein RmuC
MHRTLLAQKRRATKRGAFLGFPITIVRSMFREMSITIALILCVIAAVLAGVIGVLLGGRGGAVLKAERDAQTESFRKAIRDLEAEIAERKRLQDERDAVRLRLAAHESAQAARDEAHASQLAELRANRESLEAQFKALSAQMLEAAQSQFLERAEARFRQSEATSGDALKALLAPVESTLKRYEESVNKVENERTEAYGNLQGLMESMRVSSEAVRTEAAKLGSSLRNAPKTRGRWGEQQLQNVLEQCGLAEHTDFVTEHSIDTEDGRLRPDAIVRVPGNKLLVIDAKVSLNDYQDACEATDDLTRDACLDRHVASMRNHIQTLAAKSYQSQFEEAPDYVLMFVPGEHFIAAAIERDARHRAAALERDAQLRSPDLWNFAFEKRVLLASPTNLVAIARTIAQVWRQDGLAKEAREIGRMGGELYDRIAKVADDLGKVGTHLGRAVGSYNDFARSFESRVLISSRRLKDKHIELGKREIGEVPLIEANPRYSEIDVKGS